MRYSSLSTCYTLEWTPTMTVSIKTVKTSETTEYNRGQANINGYFEQVISENSRFAGVIVKIKDSVAKKPHQ